VSFIICTKNAHTQAHTDIYIYIYLYKMLLHTLLGCTRVNINITSYQQAKYQPINM